MFISDCCEIITPSWGEMTRVRTATFQRSSVGFYLLSFYFADVYGCFRSRSNRNIATPWNLNVQKFRNSYEKKELDASLGIKFRNRLLNEREVRVEKCWSISPCF